MGLFSFLSGAHSATMAVNRPLAELIGDINTVHPEVRRFAIGLLMEAGLAGDRQAGYGRILASAIVSLHTNRDCNEIPEEHWPELSEYFLAIGGAMNELGLGPTLVWPTHDVGRAPKWATTRP